MLNFATKNADECVYPYVSTYHIQRLLELVLTWQKKHIVCIEAEYIFTSVIHYPVNNKN